MLDSIFLKAVLEVNVSEKGVGALLLLFLSSSSQLFLKHIDFKHTYFVALSNEPRVWVAFVFKFVIF